MTRPRGQRELPTTAPAIFVRNLNGQVAFLEWAVREKPESVFHRRQLAELYQLRSEYRDDLDEIQRAIDLLTVCVDSLRCEEPEIFLLRAGLQQSLHRIAEARMDLARARRRAAPAARVGAIEQELDWLEGEYDRAIGRIREAAGTRPGTRTLARVARLEHELGNDAEARRAFARAEELVRDTSPVPLAWLNVQRGALEMAAGDPEQALIFFQEAVRRLPDHVVARAEMAAVLATLGRVDEAIRLYEALHRESPNPEHWSAATSLYRRAGEVRKADAMQASAAATFDLLLRKYPEAMYWHAAEFFLEHARDSARAVELLGRNAVLRPNAESWAALARAYEASGNVQDAGAASRRAHEARARQASAARRDA